MKTAHASLTRVLVLALLAGTAVACGSSGNDADADENRQETAASQCKAYCANLPVTCPAAVEELTERGKCEEDCVVAASTEFGRCMRNARSCEDLKVCKQTN